jgi:COP9 signalosome complex subunit 1
LLFIAGACPSLASQALSKAVDYALQGQDVQIYQVVLNHYNVTVGPQNARPVDQEWLDKTSARAQADKDKLEVELKMYTGNMIKESVRVRVRYGYYMLR